MLHRWSILPAVALDRSEQVLSVHFELLSRLRRLPEDVQRRRVDDLRDRGRRHTFGSGNEDLEIDPACRRALVELRREDRPTRFRVGQVDPYVPVEPAGPDHGGIEVLDRVGRCHHEQPTLVAVGLERGQQLVDRAAGLLICRVVAPLCDRVELIEEEKARQVLQCNLERLLDVAGRSTDQ